MRIEKIPRITEQAQKGCFEARLIEIAWHGLRHIREMYWAAFAAIDGGRSATRRSPLSFGRVSGERWQSIIYTFYTTVIHGSMAVDETHLRNILCQRRNVDGSDCIKGEILGGSGKSLCRDVHAARDIMSARLSLGASERRLP